MNIFVGNLAFDAREKDVYKLFMPFGRVSFVTIVMDKKRKRSRGFGFLEMPDELEAKAAIAALNGKELMGRPINVEPELPKKPKEVIRPKQKNNAWNKPDFNREGGYKGGRRSRSFMRRRLAAGITEPLVERKNQENPMRWRKKKPWQKKRGEPGPWQKAEGEPKPWSKSEGGLKPWQKSHAEPKTWRKSSNGKKPFRFKGQKKTGGQTR